MIQQNLLRNIHLKSSKVLGKKFSANYRHLCCQGKEKKMLKLILATELNRFLLKMNCIYNVMAKTSVMAMSTGGVPRGRLSIVLFESALGDTRRVLLASLYIFLECSFVVSLCIHVNSNWMAARRAGAWPMQRQSSWWGVLDGDFLSSRTQGRTHIATQSHCFGVWVLIG